MSRSFVQYEADGTSSEFDVPFPYIRQEHVTVLINGAPPVLPIRWVGGSRIAIEDNIAPGSLVELRRDTPLSDRLVEFQNGSVLTEDELNTAILQLFYIQQELVDRQGAAIEGSLATVANDGGIVVSDGQSVVDAIAVELIASEGAQLLEQGLADIRLTADQLTQLALDTSALDTRVTAAEATAADLANQIGQIGGNNGVAQQALDDLEASLNATITTVDSRVTTLRSDHDNLVSVVDGLLGGDPGEGVTALIQQESQARIDGDNALAETIALIGARSGDNLAFIFDTNTVRVSPTESLAERLTTISATDAANAAAITAEETARIDGDAALATSISLVDARVDGADAAILSEASARASGDAANATLISALTTRVDTAEADIVAEQTARSTADSAFATQLTGIQAQVDGNAASIITEQTARADGDSALSTRIDGLQAEVDGNAAAILSEQTARADGDAAISTSLTALTTRVGDAEALIATESTARSTADSAFASQLSGLQASIDGAIASIASEATVRADEDAILSSRIDTLSASSGNRVYRQATAPTGVEVNDIWFDTSDNNKPHVWDGTAWIAVDDERISSLSSAIVSEQTARISADSALASDLSVLSARVTDAETDIANAEAAIVAESSARVSQDNALSTQIGGLTARVTTVEGDLVTNAAAIQAEATARADDVSALSSQINSLSASSGNRSFRQPSEPSDPVEGDLWIDSDNNNLLLRYDGTGWQPSPDARISQNTAAIASEATARANAISAEAAARSALTARVNTAETGIADNASAIVSEQTARTNADSALATDIAALDTRVGTTEAAIITEQNARASGDSANASAISALTTRVNGNEATVTTLSSSVNGLSARYGVSINVNGYVTGFEQNNNGTSGAFIILADRFSIVNPNGGAPFSPFVVNGSNIDLNGNVRINGNLIVNGSITSSEIANGAVGTGNIAAGAVTKGASAYTSGGVGVGTNEVTVQSRSISTSGGDVRVDFGGNYEQQNTTSYSAIDVTYRIKRNGVTIRSGIWCRVPPVRPSTVQGGGGDGGFGPPGGSSSLGTVDVPGFVAGTFHIFVVDTNAPAGNHTYSVTLATSFGGGIIDSRQIGLLETKR